MAPRSRGTVAGVGRFDRQREPGHGEGEVRIYRRAYSGGEFEQLAEARPRGSALSEPEIGVAERVQHLRFERVEAAAGRSGVPVTGRLRPRRSSSSPRPGAAETSGRQHRDWCLSTCGSSRYTGVHGGAVMVWLCGPPSDHDVRKYVDLLNCCGDGALTEFAEPTTAVTEKGVVRGASFTTRSLSTRPPGLLLNVSTTVFWVSRTLVVALSPPESVAVSCNSSQHRYSGSGAVDDRRKNRRRSGSGAYGSRPA
jgi:hypothetical protein